MNPNIDLTLESIFLSSQGDRHTPTYVLEYRRRYGDPSYNMGKKKQRPVMFELGLGVRGVQFEEWYVRNFRKFDFQFFRTHNEEIQSYRKFFGDDYAIIKRIDPYSCMFNGYCCDCCGRSLNFLNRAVSCIGLCKRCDTIRDPNADFFARLRGERTGLSYVEWKAIRPSIFKKIKMFLRRKTRHVI